MAMTKYVLRQDNHHIEVYATEQSAIKSAELLRAKNVSKIEVWIAEDNYAENGRPISTDDLIACIWRDGRIVNTHFANEITYPAKIANKGNVRAIVVPVDVLNEMGLEVGEMVQVTLKKLPRGV